MCLGVESYMEIVDLLESNKLTSSRALLRTDLLNVNNFVLQIDYMRTWTERPHQTDTSSVCGLPAPSK